MTDRPQIATIDDLEQMRRQIVDEIRAALAGCTVTPAPEWVTIDDAAKKLDVSTSTVRRRIASGELESKGSGRLRRVRVRV